jgi:hypothetical protein
VCESQEVNRRILKQPRRIALNSANSELQCSPIKEKTIEIRYMYICIATAAAANACGFLLTSKSKTTRTRNSPLLRILPE